MIPEYIHARVWDVITRGLKHQPTRAEVFSYVAWFMAYLYQELGYRTNVSWEMHANRVTFVVCDCETLDTVRLTAVV